MHEMRSIATDVPIVCQQSVRLRHVKTAARIDVLIGVKTLRPGVPIYHGEGGWGSMQLLPNTSVT